MICKCEKPLPAKDVTGKAFCVLCGGNVITPGSTYDQIGDVNKMFPQGHDYPLPDLPAKQKSFFDLSGDGSKL